MKRRHLLISIGAVAAAGGSLAIWQNGLHKASFVHDVLSTMFGPDLTRTAAFKQFRTDFEASPKGSDSETTVGDVIEAAVFSTTVIAHRQAGEALVYNGLWNAYEATCGNPLGANFEPDRSPV